MIPDIPSLRSEFRDDVLTRTPPINGGKTVWFSKPLEGSP